ncbi:MAG: nicotinamide riboside transporter PnuC [Psychrobacillus psychrodurans]
MGMFKDWTLFEKVWLGVFTLVNIYLFFAWKDSLLGLISSLTGMLCVVLVAKGKISNYYFGIVNTSTYAYITYTYGLYGESMLNGLFYFPIQFIGIYLWRKNLTKVQAIGEDVSVKRLDKKGWAYIIVISIVASISYAYLLNAIGGQQVRLDSAAVVLSVLAQILMLKRYAEQWVLWIAVNGLTIVLWLITLTKTGGNDWSMLVMWSAFLLNSIYGYVNWLKMHKKQHNLEGETYELRPSN